VNKEDRVKFDKEVLGQGIGEIISEKELKSPNAWGCLVLGKERGLCFSNTGRKKMVYYNIREGLEVRSILRTSLLRNLRFISSAMKSQWRI
jgi:hypothetical protein